VREVVEGIEEGVGKEVVECGPLEGTSNTLDLLRRERHGRCNKSIEEGSSGGDATIRYGGGRTRDDIFSNGVCEEGGNLRAR
jgi:hypothetical protein